MCAVHGVVSSLLEKNTRGSGLCAATSGNADGYRYCLQPPPIQPIGNLAELEAAEDADLKIGKCCAVGISGDSHTRAERQTPRLPFADLTDPALVEDAPRGTDVR